MAGAPSFRSGESNSVASLPGTLLLYLIEDRYSASSCTRVPFSGTVPVWYRLSFNREFDSIDH
jgi:hypothetical protein